MATRPEQQQTVLHVLAEATRVLADADLPFALIGSIAAESHGAGIWQHDKEDIDIFLPEAAARSARDALARAGFIPDAGGPEWLLKVWKHGTLIDLIFQPSGIRWDDDIAARVRVLPYRGIPMPIVSAEDYVVMQAVAHKPDTPQYWHNGLAVLACCPLDWPYLVRRAGKDAARVLSMLAYARSESCAVPGEVLAELVAIIDRDGQAGEGAEGSAANAG